MRFAVELEVPGKDAGHALRRDLVGIDHRLEADATIAAQMREQPGVVE